jgi:uncharacterized protein (TIGR03437 family)
VANQYSLAAGLLFLSGLPAFPAIAAAAPGMVVAPSSLTFSFQIGSIQPFAQGVVLASPQTSVAAAAKPAGQSWLLLSSNSASVSANVPVLFPIGVNPAGLSPGTYKGSVTFQWPSSSQTVQVILQVTAPPILLASPPVLAFDTTSAAPPVAVVSLGTSSGTPLLGGASASVPWLNTRISGTSIQVSVDRTKAPGGVSTGFVNVTANGMANSPLAIPVVVITQPAITRVVNAASFADGPVAPGEIVTLGGPNLGPATLAGLALDTSGNVATTLAGVQVLFNGTPAPLVYTSLTQISAVVPYEIAGASTSSAQVVANGQASTAFSLKVATTVPGIFAANSSGTGQGAILNQDNSVNSSQNPAAKGSTVVVFVTGEGQTVPAGVTGSVTRVSSTPPLTPAPALPVTVTIDGETVDASFAGEAPGFVAGVLQVNVPIPNDARSGDLPIAVSIGGNPGQQGVTVSVR